MRKRIFQSTLFILPALVLYVFLVLLPATGTLIYSFYDMNGLGRKIFVGWQNYADAFCNDPIFLQSLFNNTFYLIATLIFEVGFGLMLALLLDFKYPGFSLFRILLFTPMMLSLVVVGLIWQFILHPQDGLLNLLLRTSGLSRLAQPWLANPNTALLTVCGVSGWVYSGFFMVLFYAALQRIPKSLVEAARIDGANEWKIIQHVKLPLLRDIIGVANLICATGAFKAFDLFYVMTNGEPFHTTEMIATWMMKESFDRSHFGYGCALNMIMTGIVLAVTGVFFWRQKRRSTLEYG
jgi:raffinose/stachyose/melibiose transport system permease protein